MRIWPAGGAVELPLKASRGRGAGAPGDSGLKPPLAFRTVISAPVDDGTVAPPIVLCSQWRARKRKEDERRTWRPTRARGDFPRCFHDLTSSRVQEFTSGPELRVRRSEVKGRGGGGGYRGRGGTGDITHSQHAPLHPHQSLMSHARRDDSCFPC